MSIATEPGSEHIARNLLEAVTLDSRDFAKTPSGDVLRLIDENVLGGLAQSFMPPLNTCNSPNTVSKRVGRRSKHSRNRCSTCTAARFPRIVSAQRPCI